MVSSKNDLKLSRVASESLRRARWEAMFARKRIHAILSHHNYSRGCTRVVERLHQAFLGFLGLPGGINDEIAKL